MRSWASLLRDPRYCLFLLVASSSRCLLFVVLTLFVITTVILIAVIVTTVSRSIIFRVILLEIHTILQLRYPV